MKKPSPDALKAPRAVLLAHAMKRIAPARDDARKGTTQFAHLLPVALTASAEGSNASANLPRHRLFMTDHRFFRAITNALGGVGTAAGGMPGATGATPGLPGGGAGIGAGGNCGEGEGGIGAVAANGVTGGGPAGIPTCGTLAVGAGGGTEPGTAVPGFIGA